jgi:hypothetical protein
LHTEDTATTSATSSDTSLYIDHTIPVTSFADPAPPAPTSPPPPSGPSTCEACPGGLNAPTEQAANCPPNLPSWVLSDG